MIDGDHDYFCAMAKIGSITISSTTACALRGDEPEFTAIRRVHNYRGRRNRRVLWCQTRTAVVLLFGPTPDGKRTVVTGVTSGR